MRPAPEVTSSMGEAYSRSGAAWEDGPMRVYGRLAGAVVARCPVPLAGARVLDLGAGTGAASRAVLAQGGRPVALDVAVGMMAAGRAAGLPVPAVAGDALRLPFPPGAFGAVVAAFSLNHVVDLAAALAEAVRVLAPGGGLVASGYSVRDSHPVKAAVEAALAERGWVAPAWYDDLRGRAIPGMATVEAATGAAADAGLAAEAVDVVVDMDDLEPADLVAWRLGMAHCAPYVDSLPPAMREELQARSLELLGPGPPPLRRAVVILTARAPTG